MVQGRSTQDLAFVLIPSAVEPQARVTQVNVAALVGEAAPTVQVTNSVAMVLSEDPLAGVEGFSDSEPAGGSADPSVVWDPVRVMRINWASGFVITNTWATSIAMAGTLSECRHGLVNKPYRKFQFSVLIPDAEQTSWFLDILARAHTAKWFVPLYGDFTKTTAAVAPGAIEILCDTSLRRFSSGTRVLIATLARGGSVEVDEYGNYSSDVPRRPLQGMYSCEVAYVSEVQSDRLVLHRPVVGYYPTGVHNAEDHGDITSWPAGSRVFPLAECQMMVDSSYQIHSGTVLTADFEAVEVEGEFSLPPQVEPGVLPAGFQTFEGLPIFDFKVDWSSLEQGMFRYVREDQIGLSYTVDILGTVPQWKGEYGVVCASKQQADRFNSFFASRAGRLHPFFVVGKQVLGQLYYIGSTMKFVVRGAPPVLEVGDYIGIRASDGQTYVRKVTALYAPAPGADDILDCSISWTSGNLPGMYNYTGKGEVQIFRAWKVRLNQDYIEENWSTDGIMTSNFSLVEVKQEKTVDIAGFLPPSDEGFSEPWKIPSDDHYVTAMNVQVLAVDSREPGAEVTQQVIQVLVEVPSE